MGSHARLCTTVFVYVTCLLWLVIIAAIAVRPAHAYQRLGVSVKVITTVSTQATPAKEQSTQQGQSVQSDQVPFWLSLSLLIIGCVVLLAVFGLMLWIGGPMPWRRQRQPAGWGYEVFLALLATLAAVVAGVPQVFFIF